MPFSLRPGIRRQRLLTGDRTRDGIPGVREGGDEGIADLLRLVSAVLMEELTQERVVSGKCRGEGVTGTFPKGGGPFDVGHQERDCARRQFCHGAASV